MSVRLPLLVIAAVVGGAVVAASNESVRPTLLAAPPPVAGVAAPVASLEGSLASTWYCAGGTAEDGGFADHRVTVVNPTHDEVVGQLTVFPGSLDAVDGALPAPVPHGFAVAAGERATFRLADLQSAPLASAVVELDRGGVVVEHQVSGPQGQAGAPCASATASQWHFAWGSTARDARELLVLFNPFPSSVTVDTIFVTEAGARQPLRWQGLTVPAHGVLAMDVGQDVTRRDHVAATVNVRGGGRLVVDRLQVFDGSAGRRGLQLTSGQPVGVEMSAFAAGRVDAATSEQVVIYNPGLRVAEVEVAVRGTGTSGGQVPQPFAVVVRPGRYELVDYVAEGRVPRGVDHTTVIRSRNGVPVVAERVLTGDGVVSTTPGAVFAARTWVVSTPVEGASLAIANLDAEQPTRVSIVAHLAGRQLRPADWQGLDISPNGRRTLPLVGTAGMAEVLAAHATLGAAQGDGGVTLVVEADAAMVVERTPTLAVPTPDGLTPLPP